MNLIRLLLAVSLLAAAASAAFVYGDIYKGDLERLNKTALRVSGEFSYQLVTDKGNYSIYLPDGDYNISASSFGEDGGLAYYAEERIRAGSGNQRVDLVLKPVGNDASNQLYFAVGGIVLAGIAIAVFYLNRNKAEADASEPQPVNPGKQPKAEPDQGMKSVLRALDSHEGRATQKELREALGFSDAKLSLIISELEHSGYVKKFKRGRGNIVRKL
jgi:uncharacterized membrane protein